MKLSNAAFVVLAVLLTASCLSWATTAGVFTCPAGQVEDINCAAQCCAQSGGDYDFGEETCTVDSNSQWNAAAACEQQRNCCTSSGSNGTSSSGCCGAAFVLLGAGFVGLAAATRK